MALASTIRFAAIATILALSFPAIAADKADAAIKDGARAQVYAEKCKSVKVNWFTYATMLEDAGVDADELKKGPQFLEMVKYMLAESRALKGVKEEEVCRRADAAFGEKGNIVAGLLSEGLAVKGMNSFFDWLHKNTR